MRSCRSTNSPKRGNKCNAVPHLTRPFRATLPKGEGIRFFLSHDSEVDIMNFSNAERAEVLTAALPYIKKYSGKTVVIK